jgi:hypothetical protein
MITLQFYTGVLILALMTIMDGHQLVVRATDVWCRVKSHYDCRRLPAAIEDLKSYNVGSWLIGMCRGRSIGFLVPWGPVGSSSLLHSPRIIGPKDPATWDCLVYRN